MPGPGASEIEFAEVTFSVSTNEDVMTLLAELLSNQYAFFAGVSKAWSKAWKGLPKTTQAITADTSISQLQWSFDAGLRRRPMVCQHIAEHCGVEIMQYAHSVGCDVPLNACFPAAARGTLDMIIWALDQNGGWRKDLCRAAAAGGNLRILQWAHANNCPWDSTTCREAAGSGHIDILVWARSENCPWDGETCSKAAKSGHLDILQWARAH